jgi:hypothetical protein
MNQEIYMATANKKATTAAAAQKAAAANPDLVLLIAIEPIRYNGEDFAPDSEFACDPKYVDSLLEGNHAKLAD